MVAVWVKLSVWQKQAHLNKNNLATLRGQIAQRTATSMGTSNTDK